MAFRPPVLERLGLDYERVRETNPGLVYVSITGFGEGERYRELQVLLSSDSVSLSGQ